MSFLESLFGTPVPTIQAAELKDKLAAGRRPYLIDVREPVEYRQGHIAGAKLIPLGELSTRLDELPKSRDIVCICATGHRSVPAVRKLAAAGYAALSLENGMIAWRRARLPIEKPASK
jgi:rhodanese-related sulfurtransferase